MRFMFAHRWLFLPTKLLLRRKIQRQIYQRQSQTLTF